MSRFETFVITALLYIAGGGVWGHLKERRRRRVTAMTGIPPAGHPDLCTALEEWELEALDGIEAGLRGRRDAGISIFRSEGEAS